MSVKEMIMISKKPLKLPQQLPNNSLTNKQNLTQKETDNKARNQ